MPQNDFHIDAAGSYLIASTGGGYLRRVIVNSAGSGATATLYDGTDDSGTEFAVIGDTVGTLEYGKKLYNGLFIVAGETAPDLTVIIDDGTTTSLASR